MNGNTDITEVDVTTKQVNDDKPDMNRNPSGKGGFGDNPENRSSGRWDKDTSISYWYNKIGRMTAEELKAFKAETYFQRAALKRLEATVGTDEDQALRATKEITDRTEGKPKQDIDMNIEGDDYVPIIRGFVIPTLPEDFMEDDIAEQAGEEYAKRKTPKN